MTTIVYPYDGILIHLDNGYSLDPSLAADRVRQVRDEPLGPVPVFRIPTPEEEARMVEARAFVVDYLAEQAAYAAALPYLY